MGRWFFSAVLIITSLPLFGQRIENLRASFADGKVTVLYDITGGHPEQTYAIQLFGSHDNFASALRLVTGDVGEGVKGGKDKTIVWNAEGELASNSSNLTFRVTGRLLPMKLSVVSPNNSSSFRRGRDAIIEWRGGSPDQSVKMELFEGNTRITSVGETKNTGSFTWRIPKDLAKGKYTIHFTSGPDRLTSEVFLVKPKIPLALKIAPVVLVAGGVALLLPGPDPPIPADEKLLPVAPDPQ